MKKVVATAILSLFAASAGAAGSLENDSRKFGVLSSAASMSEGGAFTVIDECVKRFPDLGAEGEKTKAAWQTRNIAPQIVLAAAAKKVAARLQAESPSFDMEAMAATIRPHAQQSITKMAGTIIQSALGNKDAATQRAGCQSMFHGIAMGRMDIFAIQKTAVRAYDEEEARELVYGYKGLSYQDSAARAEANGTWLGLALPLNETRIVADENTRTVHVISKTMIPGPAPSVSESDKTVFIETWSEDVIRSERERAGKSERFVQYVIDRKAKTVSMVFTGESPATHVLGEAGKEFRQARGQFD